MGNIGDMINAQYQQQQVGKQIQGQRSIEDEANSTKMSYQPIPDGRFYTKANFFTLGDREQVGLLSAEELPPNHDPNLQVHSQISESIVRDRNNGLVHQP